MSYVVESGASSSRRSRRRRALITLAVVALMLFFAFWYAYSYYRTSSGPTATPAPTCTSTLAPSPAKVTVNVYNATDRNGLAARTATEVRKRGFKVSTVSNDPLAKQVVGTAEVRYGKSGAPASKLVVALVKGAKAVQDSRVDGSVDLVLGEQFTRLAPAAPAPKPAAKPAATTKPSTKPSTKASTKPSTSPSPKPATTTRAC